MKKPIPFPSETPDVAHSLLNRFGLDHVNVREAAELITADMWASAETREPKAPDSWDGENPLDPMILNLLRPRINAFVQKLTGLIDSGKLPLDMESRDMDENLDPENSYVALADLREWLVSRGAPPRSTFNTYEFSVLQASALVSDEVRRLKTIARSGPRAMDRLLPNPISAPDDSSTERDLRAWAQELAEENQRLREQLAQQGQAVTAPPQQQTYERRQMHRLIAVMAIKGYEFNPNASRNSAPAEIAKAAADEGIDMTAETVRSYLRKACSELPDRKATFFSGLRSR